MTSESLIPLPHTFMVEDLRVLGVDASTGRAGKNHTDWSGSYGPLDEDDVQNVQVVIATLHAGGSSGWASVTVGGLFTPLVTNVEVTPENIAELIQGSSALEALYDFARVGLRSVAGLVDARLKTPAKSPKAGIIRFDAETVGTHKDSPSRNKRAKAVAE